MYRPIRTPGPGGERGRRHAVAAHVSFYLRCESFNCRDGKCSFCVSAVVCLSVCLRGGEDTSHAIIRDHPLLCILSLPQKGTPTHRTITRTHVHVPRPRSYIYMRQRRDTECPFLEKCAVRSLLFLPGSPLSYDDIIIAVFWCLWSGGGGHTLEACRRRGSTGEIQIACPVRTTPLLNHWTTPIGAHRLR